MTEHQVADAGYDAVSATVQMREMVSERTPGKTDGLVKLVADRATGQLLGGIFLPQVLVTS